MKTKKYMHIISHGMLLRAAFLIATLLLLTGSNVLAQGSSQTSTGTGGVVVRGNVYGGGNLANVGGSVTVNIKAGTVEKDVYGGGALANTNMWDLEGGYTEVTGLTVGVSIVTGLYTKSGDSYSEIKTANQKAASGTTYYQKGAWATGNNPTTYTTTVNLTGGTIKGDAYGGGLGQLGTAVEGVHWTQEEIDAAANDESNPAHGKTINDWKVEPVAAGADGAGAVKAMVYGDVNVNLGSSASGSSATAFYITNYTGDHSDVVKSGRVFGCNNLNGSPLGNVTVTVYNTVEGNVTRTASTALHKKESEDGYVTPTYEVAAVYGGGNLANYTAATGKKANVVIETCNVSIQNVYGGGNAAAVPETDVLVKGAYEIAEVFGGGNGKDPYTLDGTTWITNPGANVNGNANTLLTGGYIHEAYGGSNKKGTITGDVTIDVGTGGACTLDVGKIVGAGKDADVEGDLILVLGCKPSQKIPLLYAGADNANVKGNVELTITSGNFGKVFGGNNQGGAIFGHIKLNIEETGDCDTPITIDELYLGGNEAAYSQYGYYNSGTADAPVYLPRTSADDGHTVAENPADDATHTFPYAQPELNVISCTYIGKVFGGGFGTGAALYGDPIVNINMISGSKASGVHSFMADDARLTALSLPSTDNPNNLGVIGDVYGGGNAADVIGNPTVNIGTATNVYMVTEPIHLRENASTPMTPVATGEHAGLYEVNVVGAYIVGNVFGGGKGKDDTFFCEKGMIGIDGDGVEHPEGGTTVNIYNGTVRGNVYGGGEIGRVEKNTVVTIGAGDGTANGTPSPVIMGSVFGGGKGKETHGYAALVRGNPTVTIQGNASVGHSVYGGGEIASVARYKVPQTEDEVTAAIAAGYTEAVLGMPYALADPDHPSGNCTVMVQGYAKIGPDGMQMTKTGGPDDTGYVFGAGKGILPGGTYEYQSGSTRRMVLYDAAVHTADKKRTETKRTGWEYVDPDHSETNKNVWEYFADLDEYIRFIQTLALSSYTDVTIVGNALVKGSVYGGSENGIVQYDTDVKIQGGQIGVAASGSAECASWTYEAPYAPYDPYAKYYNSEDHKYYYDAAFTQYAEGGACVATDGHTYYGNVFGGGSGSVPYFDSTLGQSVYLHSAGQVKGDTHVTITDGHILTNVYGGCEATNVTGSAYVTMKGGTIGVERTDEQIIAHPLTGYLFGAGKGDQRIFFNKDTNVKDAVVTVEGGRVYGSVYGGGEDGHVLRNVTMTIGKTGNTGPTIGTRGTSYYDGHVFGGGRGFGGDALTAGNVGGAVTLDIKGGSIYGSVYGGGRLASVGYGLYLTSETGYGIMRSDTEYDGSYTNPSTEEAATFFNKGRGHITMTISGGTIGNDDEYTYDANNRLTHTKGGNVFAGGMGRLYKLDGTPNTSVDWRKMGCAKSTKLTISSNAVIKSCVYGGGELGQVVGTHTTKNAANEDVDVSTEILIQGGTIGTEIKDNGYTQYTFGSVFGGGYGSEVDDITVTIDGKETLTKPKLEAGLVHGDTKVNMSGGAVKASIYGGGEMAGVGVSTTSGQTTTVTGSTFVTVSDGTVGINRIQLSDETYRYFGGATMGNVYGGGSGLRNIVRSGSILKNATVNINGGTIYHNVYGGGAFGSVGNFTYTEDENTHKVSGITGIQTGTGDVTVTITGGIIGVDGRENGMVFGSSRGEVGEERDNWMAWVYDTHVTIGDANGGPTIKGSVYGSGENGHTWNDADVTIHDGTIGIHDGTAADATRGNVYGGGCGEDKYDSDNNGSLDMYNPLAGIVYGTTTVIMDGGSVLHNIYGAGALGSVGKPDNTGTITSGGKTTIEISGGRVGYDGNDNGNVYGAARGDVDATQTGISQVKETEVTIQYATTPTADNTDKTVQLIAGSVFGGGQAGIVQGNVTVNMTGGLVLQDVYGGGALADTQTSNWDATKDNGEGKPLGGWASGKITTDNNRTTTYKTYVNLTGGTITGNAYGGGLGRKEFGTSGQSGYVSAIAAKVFGDVLVELNNNNNGQTADGSKRGCAVSRVFGCNNLNGTPMGHVKVHVYATQNLGKATIGTDKTDANLHTGLESGTTTSYDVKAVYGGGNLAYYEPADALLNYSTNQAAVDAARTEVIIDGCHLTSIKQVYAGGNAASVPASHVTVNSAYEIEEVFGGGNGADNYFLQEGTSTVWYENPGANVGYYSYASHPKTGTGMEDGSEEHPYKAVEDTDYDTKEERTAADAIQYGSGIARTDIYGGRIHVVYGGSNKKGNIRTAAISVYDGMDDDCPINADETYGGGKDAPIDGEVEVRTNCAHGIKQMFGGAKNADVDNDVNLRITNGSSLEQVFGGNNTSGAINGSITVTIEEGGCEPIHIGELYAGGYLAPYSIYGYEQDNGNYVTESVSYIDEQGDTQSLDQRKPLTAADVATGFVPKKDPRINIISASSIGDIYGGGYQAKLVGSPHINVNMTAGIVEVTKTELSGDDTDQNAFTEGEGEDEKTYVYKDAAGNTYDKDNITTETTGEGTDAVTKTYVTLSVGTIGNIYGGGNMAEIVGDTHVEIGTGMWLNKDDVWETKGTDGHTYTYNTTSKKWQYLATTGEGDQQTTQTTSVDTPPTPARYKATITGNVYGGGNQADVTGNTFVNVCAVNADDPETANVVELIGVTLPATIGNDVTIDGNIYGGGNLGDVGTIQKEFDSSKHNFVYKWTTGTSTTWNETGVCNVTIAGGTIGPETPTLTSPGNVFGGGKGEESSYWCEKGMVYRTNVYINKGVVNGTVYGGGEIGRTEENTTVTVGAPSGTDEPEIKGNVFAAGKGLKTHGYSALVRGNPTVTVQGKAKVKGNVYGGGEIASVARYSVALTEEDAAAHGVGLNMPYAVADLNSGYCTVTITDNAIIGTTGNTNTGHVFGAGMGIEPRRDYDYKAESAFSEVPNYEYKIDDHKPKRRDRNDNDESYWQYFDSEDLYLDFVETLALASNTDITIGGSANVMGSVYGGSQSGFVQYNTQVKVQGGQIGSSVFGGGKGLASFAEAGRVRGTTEVTITAGSVGSNVYGGGELGDVGIITKPADYNYTWTNSEGAANTAGNNTITSTNKNTGICNVTIEGGTIGPSNNTDPKKGNVFGAGKGDYNTWWCEKAMVFATNVSISETSGATTVVNGNVYGGGEIGRVEDDAKVIIGTANGSDTPDIKGNVFGAGAGLATRGYSALVRGNSIVTIQGSALVGGSVFGGGEEASLGRFNLAGGLPTSPQSGGYTTVTIQDHATIGSDDTDNLTHHVYGAGKGVTPNFDPNNYTNYKSMQLEENKPAGDAGDTWDYYVDDDGNTDTRFVWVYYKTEAAYQAFLNTLALASHPTVTIAENATVYGDVYGGGQRGITLGNVAVNITGGTVKQDVYGGGSLADTNKGNWDENHYEEAELNAGDPVTGLYERTGEGTTASPYKYTEITDEEATADNGKTYYKKEATWATGKYNSTTYATEYKTNVTLTGGVVERDVYGGGLGQIARAASQTVTKLDEVKAKVYGDVLVNLNGTKTAVTPAVEGEAIVQGNIFGCNNQNGSPQSAVTVHVYKTQGWDGHEGTASGKIDSQVAADHSYHVAAVYGGGNLSAFYPDLEATRDTVQTHVIIDGCDKTSIRQVYGGGNAASTPATNITINGSYEIEEVFGGGNGLDDITIHGVTKTNPGANVGYVAYPTDYDIPRSSKEERTEKFSYGSGKASVNIFGGIIHRVFGGSNTKGNVRESAVTILQDLDGCHFQVDEAYGGGKNAPMDAEAKLLMACIPGLKVAYGGAQEADILGGVTLNVTNGTFERIFGGNNISGTIQGPIVVNIEETGCRPLIIGELYGGGNRAPYSIYGYKKVTEGTGDNAKIVWKPRESANDGTAPAGTPYTSPQVNVKSFTSIGNIYGGGYGATAIMYGDPTVNINVAEGKYIDKVADSNDDDYGKPGYMYDAEGYKGTVMTLDQGTDNEHDVTIPDHKKGEIGAIQNVFGGGNAAAVHGNTNVNVVTMSEVYVIVPDIPATATLGSGDYTNIYTLNSTTGQYTAASGTPESGKTYYKKLSVIGVDIRGNVYGGGNAAEVTGNTNVQIGKKKEQ